MATITVQFINNESQVFSSDLDYIAIEFWAGYVTTFNENIKQIVIDYENSQKIFENKTIN